MTLQGRNKLGASKILLRSVIMAKSEIIKPGYEISYLVHPDFIKTRVAGEYQGNSYKSAVTITSQTVFEQFNEQTQTTDIKKSELDFEISCDTNSKAKLLSEFIRREMESHRPILFTALLPYDNKVKVFEDADHFLNMQSQKK